MKLFKRRAILLITTMAGALVLAAGAALAANIVVCNSNPCNGTQGNDDIYGSTGAETINALAGNDFVDGNQGNDTIYGGDDSDKRNPNTNTYAHGGLHGAEGSDTVYGGAGNDIIDAAQFDTARSVDYSYGQSGNDTIYAVDGNLDIINCGSGKDTVYYDRGIDKVSKNCEIKHPQTFTPTAAAQETPAERIPAQQQ